MIVHIYMASQTFRRFRKDLLSNIILLVCKYNFKSVPRSIKVVSAGDRTFIFWKTITATLIPFLFKQIWAESTVYLLGWVCWASVRSFISPRSGYTKSTSSSKRTSCSWDEMWKVLQYLTRALKLLHHQFRSKTSGHSRSPCSQVMIRWVRAKTYLDLGPPWIQLLLVDL